jgi:hypothetical protein
MARKRDRLPPPDINQITDLKNELKEFYSRLRLEQETDQQFYDDEFEVGIRPPYHVVRTGSAAQIIRTITQHITTSNPQVFYDPKKKSQPRGCLFCSTTGHRCSLTSWRKPARTSTSEARASSR